VGGCTSLNTGRNRGGNASSANRSRPSATMEQNDRTDAPTTPNPSGGRGQPPGPNEGQSSPNENNTAPRYSFQYFYFIIQQIY
jgi:hypothetical protein